MRHKFRTLASSKTPSEVKTEKSAALVENASEIAKGKENEEVRRAEEIREIGVIGARTTKAAE